MKVILCQYSMHTNVVFISGHVITGMAAGYDNQNIMGMDNLFATTISGDLGHSGLVNSRGEYFKIICLKYSDLVFSFNSDVCFVFHYDTFNGSVIHNSVNIFNALDGHSSFP